ncbi:MAG: biopolymer transporter ExbD [Planctomycetes bacterium]|nr:biopolymer transporter ExbD [Planctomycetota bacterium]
MALRRRVPAESIQPNTTSMVDILFTILIFFIVASELRPSSVPVDLPEVSSREKDEAAGDSGRTEPITITIDATDTIYVDSERAESEEHLRELLAARATGGPGNRKVVLRTDQAAKGARLVEVVAVLSEVGLRSVEFDVTEKREP